jgi:hypothetical protein
MSSHPPDDDDQRIPDYERDYASEPVTLPTAAISRANRLGVRAAFCRPAPTRAEKLGVASSSNQRAARLGIGSSLSRRAERLGFTAETPADDGEKSA